MGAYVVLLAGTLALASCTRSTDTEPVTTTLPTTSTTAATATTEPGTGDPLASLERMRQPAHDPAAWYEEIGLAVPQPAEPRSLAEVGDVETFVVDDGVDVFEVEAELVHANSVVTMWAQSGEAVDTSQLAFAATVLETDVLPRITPVFGSLPGPGVDGDPRVTVLHLETLGGALGEFGAYDLLPKSMFPDSNEREMIYIGLDGLEVGSDAHIATLAHELQHLIDATNRINTPLWLAEGFAQLAEEVAGYNAVSTDRAYLATDSVQLDDWSGLQFDDRHYGAGYLFSLYLWERVGADAIRDIATSPFDGLGAVADVLERRGLALREVFGDWMVANYLDDESSDGGRFGYMSDDPRAVCPVHRITTLPATVDDQIPQFAPDYVTVTGDGRVDLEFAGATDASILGAPPHEGDWFWWSGRGDNSAPSLTREFDLSGVDAATLEFRIWHDLGLGDIAVVSASTNGGRTWTVLQGRQSEATDLGDGIEVFAYTGVSGKGGSPQWMRDQIDLRRFAGDPVMVRFEFISDLFETRTGIGIDSIAVPELDFTDGAETEEAQWVADGFVRAPAVIDQLWELRVIQPGAENLVRSIPVVGGSGTHQLSLTEAAPTAIVAIAATAPATIVPTSYRIEAHGDAVVTPGPLADGVDDFTDECTGWELETESSYAIRHDEGQLTLDLFGDDVFTWSARDGYVEDATVSVTAEFGEGSGQEAAVGVLCRLTDNGFYDIEVASDGQVFAGVATADDYVVLQEWTVSDAVVTGDGGTNQLDVGCVGDRITLDVNGTRVFSIEDDRHLGGQVALVGASFNGSGFSVSYDDFAIDLADPSRRPGFVRLDDAGSGWSGWSTESTDRAETSVRDGSFLVSVAASDASVGANPGLNLADVVIDVDVRVLENAPDGSFAVSCRASGDDAYTFFLGLDGFYSINATIGDEFLSIVDWQQTRALNQVPGAVNHLRVECIGTTLRFLVNGLEIARADDDRLATGDIGVSAWTFVYGNYEVAFDRVLVRTP